MSSEEEEDDFLNYGPRDGSFPDWDTEYDVFETANLQPIITRKQWGALEPFAPSERLPRMPGHVAFNYNSGVPHCKDPIECKARMRQLQLEHVQLLGFNDIAYNFVIGGDGNIYEGLGWKLAPSKEINQPEFYGNKIDIAWFGDNLGSEDIPPRQMGLAYKLIHLGVKEGFLHPNYDIFGIKEKSLLERTKEKEDVKEKAYLH